MATKKNVQDTHISAQLKALHGALISIVSVMNRPRNDERLINAAGLRLDQALFRLLVVIERLGPLGVVELADRLGRDYTTVSRQVARLESMELVIRRDNERQGDDRASRCSSRADGPRDLCDVVERGGGRPRSIDAEIRRCAGATGVD
jgi:DNA-binding transcriptional ArsR family regulator